MSSFYPAIPSIFVGALMFGAQVGPSDAELNLCKWPKLLTVEVPDHCLAGMSTTTFNWVTGVTLVLAIVWALWPWASRRFSIKTPSPALNQRIPLIALLDEAKKLGWVFLGKRDALFTFEQGLTQAAFEGTVELWGIDLKRGQDITSAPRIYRSEKIAPSYFKAHWIDIHQGLVQGDNAYTVATRPSDQEPSRYTDLHAPRAQVMAWLNSEGENLRRRVPLT